MTEVVADVLVQIEANNSKHSTTTWVLITIEDTGVDGIANIVDDDDDNDGWLDSEEAVCLPIRSTRTGSQATSTATARRPGRPRHRR